MRAVVQFLPVRDAYQVWLIVAGAEEGVLRPSAQETDATARFRDAQPFDPATEVPPTFEMDRHAFEALMSAGGDALPPSSSQARHLDDAVAVRDRLLTSVELALASALPAPPTQHEVTER